ncbi:fatty acyl-CoA synthetase [Gordonia soli]|uniref:Putative fatty-acid--CoA ligase n=1 Tax=Gordonia soli NBRC 108243 TaxID=1223545 RepID=M0QF24_9ACTN|nr:fatty acyl-CoA synthetase [Gordonia soli]GAC67193.1 putative fatty-acid--CoA ligase [Gordonia soli NBRC 108243]
MTVGSPDGRGVAGSVAAGSDIAVARSQTVGDIPRRSAARTPDKLAVIHRDTRLTFREFDIAVDRVAAALYDEGIRRGDTVALLSHNCWQYPVVIFAAARIAAVAVPINFMLTAPEVAYILDDCSAACLVVEDALIEVAESAIAASAGDVRVRAVIDLDGAIDTGWPSIAEWTDGDRGPAPHVEVSDDDVVRIMYTSGTESRPKGAMHTSRSLMWQYMSCIVTGGMSGDDVEVHSLPLYHCAQLDNFFTTDLYLGATSIILDRPDPSNLLRTIASEGATKLFCPPTVWIALLRSPDFDPSALSTLRKGYYGASALPTEILREMTARLPGLRLWNFYGQTEMASLATALGPDDQETRSGSAGRPALNVQTQIVDEADRPVGNGTVGEIVHRSPQATVGYLNQPEKTAESFRSGWFHSGDLGYFDEEGYLWVVDRQKDMIKTGGENVSSREVEEVLFEIPGVREAAVFGVPHPRWIEAIAVVVVTDPDAADTVTVDEETVLRFCRERLAGYKVPKYVIVADALPKNPSGKILKRTLRDTYGTIADRER